MMIYSLFLFENDFYSCRNWLDQGYREYDSFAEYQQRIQVFKENYIQIQKMNEVYG